MNVIVQRAGPADAAALVELNRQFNGLDMPAASVAQRLSGNRREVVLLAREGEAAVGFACVQFSLSVCYPRPWAEVTEMYVRRGYRRRGAGSALLAAAERVALRRHVEEIVVLTGQRNAAGQRLYTSAGYRDSGKSVFGKALLRRAARAARGRRP